jgi:hypothetical protein
MSNHPISTKQITKTYDGNLRLSHLAVSKTAHSASDRCHSSHCRLRLLVRQDRRRFERKAQACKTTAAENQANKAQVERLTKENQELSAESQPIPP